MAKKGGKRGGSSAARSAAAKKGWETRRRGGAKAKPAATKRTAASKPAAKRGGMPKTTSARGRALTNQRQAASLVRASRGGKGPSAKAVRSLLTAQRARAFYASTGGGKKRSAVKPAGKKATAAKAAAVRSRLGGGGSARAKVAGRPRSRVVASPAQQRAAGLRARADQLRQQGNALMGGGGRRDSAIVNAPLSSRARSGSINAGLRGLEMTRRADRLESRARGVEVRAQQSAAKAAREAAKPKRVRTPESLRVSRAKQVEKRRSISMNPAGWRADASGRMASNAARTQQRALAFYAQKGKTAKPAAQRSAAKPVAAAKPIPKLSRDQRIQANEAKMAGVKLAAYDLRAKLPKKKRDGTGTSTVGGLLLKISGREISRQQYGGISDLIGPRGIAGVRTRMNANGSITLSMSSVAKAQAMIGEKSATRPRRRRRS